MTAGLVLAPAILFIAGCRRPLPIGVGPAAIGWFGVSVLTQVAPAAAGVATVAGLAATGAVAHLGEKRERELRPADLADALEELARALRSGSSPRQALAEVGPGLATTAGSDLRRLHTQVERGLPLSLVLRRWSRWRSDVPEVRTAGVALAFAVETGGSAARAVDDVADAVRTQTELRGEVQALAAQARASAVVIGALPVGFLALATAADPATLGFLVGTGIGLVCAAAGLGLQVVGWWWMRRIVREASA